MATFQIPIGSSFVLGAEGLYTLGNASGDAENGGLLIQIVDDNSLSATITVKAQSLVATRAGVTDQFVAVDYRGGNINGTAASWAFVSTGLTTDSLIFVPAGGMTVGLDTTGAFTSGSVTVYATPVLGACSF